MLKLTPSLFRILVLICFLNTQSNDTYAQTLAFDPAANDQVSQITRQLGYQPRLQFITLQIGIKPGAQPLIVKCKTSEKLTLSQMLLLSAVNSSERKIILVWPSKSELSVAQFSQKVFEKHLQDVLMKSSTRPSQFIFALDLNSDHAAIRKRWKRIPYFVKVNLKEASTLKLAAESMSDKLNIDGVLLFGDSQKNQQQLAELLNAFKRKSTSRWIISPLLSSSVAIQKYNELGVDVLRVSTARYFDEYEKSIKGGQSLTNFYSFDDHMTDRGPANQTAGLKDPLGGNPVFGTGVFGESLILQRIEKKPINPVRINCRLDHQGTLTFWYRQPQQAGKSNWSKATLLDQDADADLFTLKVDSKGKLTFQLAPDSKPISYPLHEKADAGSWHHLGISWRRFSRTSDQFILYHNGRKVLSLSAEDSKDWQKHWPEKLGSLFLGGGHPKNTRTHSEFDDLAFFNRSLPEHLIQLIYQKGIIENFYNWRGKLVN